MEWILLLLLVAALGVGAVVAGRRSQERALANREAELAPVRKLAFEDITAFGEDLQQLDLEMTGHELDEGANADYQRALDTYEAAKVAGDSISQADDIRHVTEIVEDGRYAIACVRARVAGQPLPTRRPPCFFDPRHGPSVADVPFMPPDGIERDVPACVLDAARIRAGAEPDTRKVMVGAQRVPYWQGGRAYEPYALGYFGAFGPMTWMFMGGMMFGGFGGGGGDGGDGGGDGGDGGDGGGDGGDGGGYDGGGRRWRRVRRWRRLRRLRRRRLRRVLTARSVDVELVALGVGQGDGVVVEALLDVRAQPRRAE